MIIMMILMIVMIVMFKCSIDSSNSVNPRISPRGAYLEK